jgi:hypothetical protein
MPHYVTHFLKGEWKMEDIERAAEGCQDIEKELLNKARAQLDQFAEQVLTAYAEERLAGVVYGQLRQGVARLFELGYVDSEGALRIPKAVYDATCADLEKPFGELTPKEQAEFLAMLR